MFKSVKNQVKEQFDKMVATGRVLFITDTEKDKLWDAYLNGFESEEERQHHNCNCCRQFIKNYGKIVIIKDNKLVTVWDFLPTEPVYEKSIRDLGDIVRASAIQNRFINDFPKLGTDSNYDVDADVTWTHFFVVAPHQVIVKKDHKDTILSQWRDGKNVFKRALEEFTLDAVDTVLELCAQGSLYRGNEFEGNVRLFKSVFTEYRKEANRNDNFIWHYTTQVGLNVQKIRNSAIGTLLIDLSEGVKSLDECVTAYERVVAPTNYKRPTALVTKGMIEDAEKKIEELGLKESLGRRFATPEDISVDNVLFVNRDAKAAGSVFEEMKEDVQVHPKSFSKTEEITLDKFISEVIPTASSVELLVENSHLSNLVSVIAPVEPEAPSLFKWDNPFSWSYANNLADSMKERVKEAGGNVNGVLRFTIQWNEDGKDILDFDAHAHEPDGTRIYYGNYKGRPTKMSGMLDVDMINPRNVGVENIVWTDKAKMVPGVYKFDIRNFNSGRNHGFSAQVEFDGQIFEFSKSGNIQGTTHIAEVTLSKTGEFSINPLLDGHTGTGNIVSKEKWGVSTNKFQKVSMIMNSPNHWNNQVGNKHVFFVLEGAKNDESPRGFYNEFLKSELETNRKVFEVLGSKLKVEPSDRQLTGVGFSDTQRNSFVVRVEGKFKRTLKVIV